MKKLLKSSFLLLLLLSLALLAFTACKGDKPEESETESESEAAETVYALEMSADKTTVKRGDTVTLSAVLRAEGAEDIPSEGTRYQITYGAEYATVTGNTLTVLPTANDGQTIRVRAQEGATFSPELTLTVAVPAESITLDANGVTNVMPGAITLLNASILPAGACDDIEWLVDGKATVTGNVLAVSAQAKTGETVKVKAKIGDTVSDELVFTVGIPLTGLEIAIDELNDLLENDVNNIAEFVKLTATVLPADATNGGYEWVATQNGEHVRFDGDKMILKDTAVTGMIIKVKAVATADETITSDELTFTVGYPIEKLTATVTGGSANVNNGDSVTLFVAPTPSVTTNGSYRWVFITENWEEYVTLEGDVLTVKDDAPFDTEIKLKAVSTVDETVVSNEITVVVGIPITDIQISLPSAPAILEREGKYLIDLKVLPEDAATNTVVWTVTGDNAPYAKVENGYLVIDKGAIAGKSITLTASSGDVSDSKTFQIGIALDKLEIALVGSANVDPDGTRVILVTPTPANASDTEIEWIEVENGEYFDIVNHTLVIASDAKIGAVIKFRAKIADVLSDVISVTVGTPIQSITLNYIGASAIVKGNTAGISVTLDPAKASKELLEWVVLDKDGNVSTVARVVDGTLVIDASAPTGEKLYVKAIYEGIDGEVSSDPLEFTVKATPEEEAALKYYFKLTDVLTFDTKGGKAPIQLVTLKDGNGKEVTDIALQYSILSGAQYLALDEEGGLTCKFIGLGHGTATVEVRVPGTDFAETFDVNVIVPPDSVKLPEVFLERPTIEYQFSLIDHASGNPEILPFRPTVNAQNALACKDYTVEFYNATTGASGDAVGTYDYDGGTLTFKQQGKVTVTVSSASGSKTEAKTQYTFRINDGYNVSTYEEMQKLINTSAKESGGYNGEQINIVVTEKPGDGYGYDLVPAVAFKPASEQTVSAVTHIRMQALNCSLYINGNGHKIDASKVRVYTYQEYIAYKGKDEATLRAENAYIPNTSSLLSAEAWSDYGPDSDHANQHVHGKQYKINVYNLEIVGNASVNYDPWAYNEGNDEPDTIGIIHYGFSIGTDRYRTNYYVDVDGLTVSGCFNGIGFENAVDSVAKNLYAYNCYSTGVMCSASIITFDGLKFGKCGATGMEMTPTNCGKAGINRDQNQQVTFVGDIDASTNLNDGKTNYFNNYYVMGNPVIGIIEKNVTLYCTDPSTGKVDQKKLSHLQNADKEFVFVSLIFNDLGAFPFVTNTTQVNYSGYLATGSIDITKIGLGESNVDTTHQFISLDIIVEIPGVPGQHVAGKALFLNQNYKAQTAAEE